MNDLRLPFAECLSFMIGGDLLETSGTKTKLVPVDGMLVAEVFNEGVHVDSAVIIPDINDVKVIEKNCNPKVVKVLFSDGTVEKAVLDENDTYSLEQGISICITKRILSMYTSNGSSIYNKLISRAMNVMENNKKNAEEEARRLSDEKARAERIAAKKKQRAEKRAAAQREDYINAHAEAYVRAMRKIREDDKAELNQTLEEVSDEFDKFLENLLGQCKEELELEEKKTEAASCESKTVSEMNESHE